MSSSSRDGEEKRGRIAYFKAGKRDSLICPERGKIWRLTCFGRDRDQHFLEKVTTASRGEGWRGRSTCPETGKRGRLTCQ